MLIFFLIRRYRFLKKSFDQFDSVFLNRKKVYTNVNNVGLVVKYNLTIYI